MACGDDEGWQEPPFDLSTRMAGLHTLDLHYAEAATLLVAPFPSLRRLTIADWRENTTP